MSLSPAPIRHLHPIPPAPRPARDLRIGDDDRNRVCDALSAHFAAGRLTPDELEVRLETATSAVTQRDLAELLGDLPPLTASGHLPYGAVPATTPQTWSPLDVTALVMMVLGLGFVGLMLVGSALISPMVTFFSLVGGTAAAVTGGLIVHLIHRARMRAASGEARELR